MTNRVSFLIQFKERYRRQARNLRAQFAKIKQSADSAEASISKFEKRSKSSFETLGKRAVKAGALMTAGITVPLLFLSRNLIKAASDAEEIDGKFNQIFGSVSGSSEAVKSLSSSYKLASTTSKELLSDTGAILSASGLQKDRVLEISKVLNGAAIDLSSFHNFQGSAAESSMILSKALLGEAESLKTNFGITIVQNKAFQDSVKLKQRQSGLSKQAAKAEVVFAEILKQAGKDGQKALGDFARTQKGYANQTKILAERKRELAITFGKLLLPFAIKLNNVLIDLIGWINSLSPATKRFVVILAAMLAILPPLILLAGSLALAIGVISLPILIVGAAIAGLIVAGAALYANWSEVVGGLKAIWSSFSGWIGDLLGTIGDLFVSLFEGRFIDAIKHGVNFGIKLLNGLLEPLNFVMDLLGFDGVKIPEIKVSTDTGQITSQTSAVAKKASGNVSDGRRAARSTTARDSVAVGQKAARAVKQSSIQQAGIANVNASVNVPPVPASNGKASIEGNFVVSAAQGATIEKADITSSTSDLDLGINMINGVY